MPPPKKKPKSDEKPVGVEDDYQATRQRQAIPEAYSPEGNRPYAPGQQEYVAYKQAPTFYDDDLNRPYAWSPNSVASLQSDLVAAGLLSKKGFSLGVYDDSTRNAFKKVLTYANRSGLTSIDEAIGTFLNQPRGGAGAGGRTRAPFSAQLPNPDDVKAIVDATVPKIIGRTLTDPEKQAVIAAYNAVATGAQQASYNAAESGGTVTEAPSVDTFVENKAKELAPEEANTFQKFSLVGDVIGLLGLNGG